MANNDWTVIIIIIIVLIVLWLLFANNNNTVNVEGFNGEEDVIAAGNGNAAALVAAPEATNGNGLLGQRWNQNGSNKNWNNNRRRNPNAGLNNCITPPYVNLRCTVNQLRNGNDIDSALESCTVPAKVKNSCRRVLGSNSNVGQVQIQA